MDVSMGDNIRVILEDSGSRHRGPAVKRVTERDRRRDRRDHRKGAREGVVVHLSGKAGQHHSAKTGRPRLTY